MKTPEPLGFYPKNQIGLLLRIVDTYLIRVLESSEGKHGTVGRVENALERYTDDLDRILKEVRTRERWHVWAQSICSAVIGAILGSILTAVPLLWHKDEPQLRPAGAPASQIDQGAEKQGPDGAHPAPKR